MLTKTRLTIATVLAAGGVGAIAAPAALANITYTGGNCSAVASDDGHKLYVDLCGTDARGSQWRARITTCSPGGCRVVTTSWYAQGRTVPYSTSGYISGVSWDLR